MIVVKVITAVLLAGFAAVCETRRQLIGEPWPGFGWLFRRLFPAQ